MKSKVGGLKSKIMFEVQSDVAGWLGHRLKVKSQRSKVTEKRTEVGSEFGSEIASEVAGWLSRRSEVKHLWSKIRSEVELEAKGQRSFKSKAEGQKSG